MKPSVRFLALPLAAFACFLTGPLLGQSQILSAKGGLSSEWAAGAWAGLKVSPFSDGGRQVLRVMPEPGKTQDWAGVLIQPSWNQPAGHHLPLTASDLAAGALTLRLNGLGGGGHRLQFSVGLIGVDGVAIDTKGFLPLEQLSKASELDADPATWQDVRIPFATLVARAKVAPAAVAGLGKLTIQIQGTCPAGGFDIADISFETGDPRQAAAAQAAATSLAALTNPRLEASGGDAAWNYVAGAPLRFTVKIAADQPVPLPVEVRYRLGYEKFEGPTRSLTVPPEGASIDFGVPDKPGFVRLQLIATIAGKELKKNVTVAVSADQLRPVRAEPADFDAFWAEGRRLLDAVPADPQLTPRPELSGPAFDAYELALATYDPLGATPRFYGILCVPKGPGPFPAILQTPGAGVRAYKGEIWVPRDQFITLEVGIHGIPVTQPGSFYAEQAAGPLKDYQVRNLHDRETFYYRRVYLGVLRSLDYLASHPKWDGKNLLARGGSQGGQLAIVAAALDPRVTAVAAAFPAWCDVAGYTVGRAGGWPGLFTGKPPEEPAAIARRAAQLETTGYYDTVNFARRLKVPAYFAWGYNDDVCPPTSFYAMLSVVTAPKEVRVWKEAAHNLPGDGWGAYTAWTVSRAKGAR